MVAYVLCSIYDDEMYVYTVNEVFKRSADVDDSQIKVFSVKYELNSYSSARWFTLDEYEVISIFFI